MNQTQKLLKAASFFKHPYIYFSSSSSSSTGTRVSSLSSQASINPSTLTEEELTQINLLIPSLCSSNQLKQASNLITTTLLTNPPLESLSLSIFIHTLAIQPDLTLPMYFLNNLKHSTPIPQSFTLPFAKMLVSSFFQKGQPKRAFKIFQWVSRPDFSPAIVIDSSFCSVLVGGFCANGMVLEGLKVLKVMLEKELKIGDESRILVYRGLLREARIKEAKLLNESLLENLDDGTNEKVSELLDHMISNWVE